MIGRTRLIIREAKDVPAKVRAGDIEGLLATGITIGLIVLLSSQPWLAAMIPADLTGEVGTILAGTIGGAVGLVVKRLRAWATPDELPETARIVRMVEDD